MSEPTYPGPRSLHTALSALHVERGEQAVFEREGLRADSEYQDLGLAAATGGRLGVKHIRAIAHFIYVLRGWITFGFAGVDEELTLRAGDSLSQPAGVPHNVIARSEDFEVLELNVPAEYGTFDLPNGGG